MHLSALLGRRLAPVFRSWGQRRARGGVESALRAARAVMRRKRYCLLATRGADGIDARVLQPFPADEDFEVWLGTCPRSRKVEQLTRDPEATLVYQDDRGAACVVLTGVVQQVADLDERRRRFMPTWWAFFPDGPEGAYVLLHFVPRRLEVIDFRRRVTPAPFGLRAATLVRGPQGWVST